VLSYGRICCLQYLDFQALFGGGTLLCFITCNVILYKETASETYSIFYGQTFTSNPRGAGEERYCLAGPFLLQDATDIADLPLHPTESETIEAFEGRKIALGSVSGTSVHSVVNLVVVLRKFLPKTRLLKAQTAVADKGRRKRESFRRNKWHNDV